VAYKICVYVDSAGLRFEVYTDGGRRDGSRVLMSLFFVLIILYHSICTLY
jgi:hypothetical protein